MEVRNLLPQELQHRLHDASAGNMGARQRAGLPHAGTAIRVSAWGLSV